LPVFAALWDGFCRARAERRFGRGRELGDEPSAPPNAVRVRAPARLHLGFLDLNGGLGRRFGSIGLALEEPNLDLVIRHAADLATTGPEPERARRAVAAAAAHLGTPDRVAVDLRSIIPPHAGFGSGTQLSIALAAGLARLFGVPLDLAGAASALDRGNRSGIGLAAFAEGGFVVDGGRDGSDRPPPVTARLPFPPDWRILLLLDPGRDGVHGSAETEAFRELPVFPGDTAAHLCRITLMQVLPALATRDLTAFGRGVAEIQRRVGDHFAPFQGGSRFTSPAVAEALALLEEDGVEGVGQSSWGPTGFAFLPSDEAAGRAVDRLEARTSGLHFRVTCGRNRGADITEFIPAT